MAGPSEYVLEPIRESAEFAFYRARQQGNPSPLLVVAPTAEQPLPESLRRLAHEYSFAGELDPAWAAEPLALTRYGGRTILVLADPGGEPLDRILEREREEPLDLARLLRVAINLATALGHVHQSGLIHKDVKPENVLVDDSGSVWLTGFGIASRLLRERPAPAPPEILAGTLAYMSPEQTGRMNRSVDTRSDLYSLGITLYQMLTGMLPFVAGDPLEWVHCHIARQPVAPVDRSAIPESVSNITMRLLAKNAEERYQTAAGLEADLRRCLTEWQSHGHIDPFPLGTNDSSDRLLIPEKLYGREREVNTLLAAFDRVVAQGSTELVLVSGYSGVGKSSVVNELHKVLVPPRGLFAAGKFDHNKRDVPYATQAQAFQTLVRQILVKSEAEVDHWRRALLEALGPNGQLMVNLVPELEFVIGRQPPVAELPPREARSRFQLVFQRLFGAFARPEHPLALFLDDLQWLDAATLDLIEDVLTRSDLQHLMLIGAYRNNEVGDAHPLRRKLDAIKAAGGKVTELALGPLGRQHLGQLIADALCCSPRRATPLAKLLHDKTGGNPFFAIRFVASLAEEGMLAFDHKAARWSWDLRRIDAKRYTDNVVDLMAGKLTRLPPETQQALQVLACLGHAISVRTLSIALGTTEERVHEVLWHSIRDELIEWDGSSYRFTHDRVQEAAYSLLPEGLRAELHLRIGRLLVANTPVELREEATFEIVNQLNRGVGLITSDEEREQLAEFNLLASRRAKASAAYASALNYVALGAGLLPESAWERRHDLIFALELLRAECEFLTGELAAADTRLDTLSKRAAGAVEQAAVVCLRMDLYPALDQIGQALAVGLDYLRLLGIDWPPHPTDEEARREYERIWSQLGSRTIEELIDLPLMTDPAALAALDVLMKLWPATIFTDINLSTLTLCRAVSLSLEHGNSDDSSTAYVRFGAIAGSCFGDYQAALRFGRLGYELVEERGLKRFQGRTYMLFAVYILPLTKHVMSARDVLRRAFLSANESGDLTFASYCAGHLNNNMFAAGDPLVEVQREAEQALAVAQKMRFGWIASDAIASQLQLARMLRGLTRKFGSFDDEQFSELQITRRFKGNPSLWYAESLYWIRKLQTCVLAGDYAAAVDASLLAQQLPWASLGALEVAEYHFYTALARAACCDAVAAEERPRHLGDLAAHRQQLDIRAKLCPENFENRAALVGAEIARLEGRDVDAMRLYEQAIRSAHANGFVHNEAVAYEVAARFYAARGFDKFADSYLREARHCYTLWGADGKVKQLDERYPRLREGRTVTPLTTIAPPVGQLDVETVVKASQAISSEIVLPALIEKLLQIAVENAGAERGLLILLRGGELRIEAEATTGHGRVEVTVRQAAVTPSDLPQSTLHYVIRTQDGVLLDDALADDLYSNDEYVQRKRSRSVLCLPIVKQAKLAGALYLENNLTAGAFTPDRVTLLQSLASQAAISLENATLYTDLQLQVGLLQHLPVSAWTLKPDGTPDFVNQVWLEFSGQTLDFVQSHPEAWMTAVHPDDRELAAKSFWNGVLSGEQFSFEIRSLRARDDTYRWHLQQAVVLRDAEGKVLRFVGTTTDIDDQKRAEEKIRQSEKQARQLLDLSPLHITELSPDGALLYTNRSSLDYYGITLDEWQDADSHQLLHPQDAKIVTKELPGKLQSGSPFEDEARLKRKDGQYRWFLIRYNPFHDEQGRIIRWYATSTDIEDRKQAEERTHNENLALREEITRSSMFEEIVGSSAPLRKVLSDVARVAPSDSTVLISGETGTGKELIARAIHKRSNRSTRAFISVNCGAIPQSLIASELFGHERGAFTGALQRRAGRFEVASGGTIFLDEIGELPVETQVALLRVLQEREIERVGGSETIKVDVRVIAATNRDLKQAAAAGTFRQDLFYRLNVFPIQMPPLRDRGDDITVLVGYLIDRYAKRAGKKFSSIGAKTLDAFQKYSWPGNVRELQNVIERAVVLCDGPTFSVDSTWFNPAPTLPSNRKVQAAPVDNERALIEAALAETHGRISGPSGAAAKLGITRQTLEYKIRRLGINKHKFQT
jgi:PAS domain S-box-containing protein